MNDEERIIHALNELADIEKENSLKKEEERKREKAVAEKRKRLYKYFYEEASPISMHIPKGAKLSDLRED